MNRRASIGRGRGSARALPFSIVFGNRIPDADADCHKKDDACDDEYLLFHDQIMTMTSRMAFPRRGRGRVSVPALASVPAAPLVRDRLALAPRVLLRAVPAPLEALGSLMGFPAEPAAP